MVEGRPPQRAIHSTPTEPERPRLTMASYKEPSFQERTALARETRAKALKQLAERPAVDEALVAQRQAARLAREAAEAEKRAARKAAILQAKADKAAAAPALAPPEPAPAEAPAPTEAELKAARDARYAARKHRKR